MLISEFGVSCIVGTVWLSLSIGCCCSSIGVLAAWAPWVPCVGGAISTHRSVAILLFSFLCRWRFKRLRGGLLGVLLVPLWVPLRPVQAALRCCLTLWLLLVALAATHFMYAFGFRFNIVCLLIMRPSIFLFASFSILLFLFHVFIISFLSCRFPYYV